MSFYINRDGQRLQCDREIGRGGEGIVYAVAGRSDVVAKIYHPAQRTESRHAKLAAMITQPPADRCRTFSPPHVSLAWPTDLLFERDSFAGFLMPRIERSPNIVALFNPMLRRQRYPQANRRFLYRSAQNLAAVLAALHGRGHVVGDLNQKNILVKANALVTLVDTDSFQIGDGQGTYFPCPVGVPEYTPPELQGQLLAEITRQPCHDCFGLSVLLFQLLMEGYHPFTGRPLTAALREMEQLSVHCMQQGWFPYSNNQAVQPPPAAPPFTELPAEIRRLFLQSFLVGYTNPVLRPTAATWAQALSRAELNLVQCQKQREHWYSNHLKRCPYCQITPTVSTSSKNSVHPPRPTTPIFGAKAAPAISGAATPPIRPSSAPVAWAAELVQAAIGTLVFVVIFQAYWPILFGAFFALRNAQLRHFLWVAAKVCFRGFVSGSRLLGKGIAHTVRWLTPHARRGGRIFVAHWRGRPTALKEWVVVGLLIVLLVFINYLSSNPMAMSRQPDSPLLVSPLAQPVSGRGE